MLFTLLHLPREASVVRVNRPDDYALRQSCNMLGIDSRRVLRLANEGYFPLRREVIHSTLVHLVPREYVHGLARDLEIMRSYGSQVVPDSAFVLYYASFLCQRRPFDLDEQGISLHIKPLRELCENAVAAGELMTLASLQEVLAPYAARGTVKDWKQKGKLVAHKVGRLLYTPTQHANQLVWLLSLPSIHQAAAALHLSHVTIRRRIAQGEGEAYTDPAGSLRVNMFMPSEEPTLSTAEFAARLGENVQVIRGHVEAGRIMSVGLGRRLRIPVSEAERIEHERTTLNPGFEWLQALFFRGAQKPITLGPKQVARELGLELGQIRMWSGANILPYYVGWKEGKQFRQYPQRYIWGLKRAIVSPDIPKRGKKTAAAAYLQNCRDAQQIV
jgi:hypothetical protein